jgi:hypothetical protein
VHAVLHLASGLDLRYVDQKKMGQVFVTKQPPRQAPIADNAGMGPEAPEITREDFKARLKKFRGEIKGVLTRGISWRVWAMLMRTHLMHGVTESFTPFFNVIFLQGVGNRFYNLNILHVNSPRAEASYRLTVCFSDSSGNAGGPYPHLSKSAALLLLSRPATLP